MKEKYIFNDMVGMDFNFRASLRDLIQEPTGPVLGALPRKNLHRLGHPWVFYATAIKTEGEEKGGRERRERKEQRFGMNFSSKKNTEIEEF